MNNAFKLQCLWWLSEKKGAPYKCYRNKETNHLFASAAAQAIQYSTFAPLNDYTSSGCLPHSNSIVAELFVVVVVWLQFLFTFTPRYYFLV